MRATSIATIATETSRRMRAGCTVLRYMTGAPSTLPASATAVHVPSPGSAVRSNGGLKLAGTAVFGCALRSTLGLQSSPAQGALCAGSFALELGSLPGAPGESAGAAVGDVGLDVALSGGA